MSAQCGPADQIDFDPQLHEDAEHLVREAMLKAYRLWHQVQPANDIPAWLLISSSLASVVGALMTLFSFNRPVGFQLVADIVEASSSLPDAQESRSHARN